MGVVEMSRMQNTIVKGAIGSKSRNITHHILIEMEINGRRWDCVFVILPEMIRKCIIGIELLHDDGCILDLAQKLMSSTTEI